MHWALEALVAGSSEREGGEGGPEGAGVVRHGYWLTHPGCTLFRVVVGNLHVF